MRQNAFLSQNALLIEAFDDTLPIFPQAVFLVHETLGCVHMEARPVRVGCLAALQCFRRDSQAGMQTKMRSYQRVFHASGHFVNKAGIFADPDSARSSPSRSVTS